MRVVKVFTAILSVLGSVGVVMALLSIPRIVIETGVLPLSSLVFAVYVYLVFWVFEKKSRNIDDEEIKNTVFLIQASPPAIFSILYFTLVLPCGKLSGESIYLVELIYAIPLFFTAPIVFTFYLKLRK